MDSWQRYSLKELCSIVRGGSPRPISQYITSGEGYNWLKIGDTQNISKYIYQTKQKIKKEGLKKTRLVHKNDFILSNSMSFGKPFIMQTEACIHDGWLSLSISDPSVLDTDFLYYLLSSQLMFRKFNERAAGSSVRNLKIELVNEVEVYLPPLPEQKAIADILQTWDTAIEKTEALIAAKEKQFDWLCQRFFTPNSQVTSLWEHRRISDFVKTRKEKSVPSENKPLYSLTIEDGVTSKSDRYNREFLVKDKGNKAYKVVHPKDIVFNPANLRWGAIARSEVSHRVVISPIYEVLEVLENKIDKDYLTYALTCKRQIRIFSTMTEGTLIERMAVKADTFQLCEIIVPPTKEQQKRIAETLNTARQEIDTLKTLANRYRTQKRGLMQKLLTGKWRVKI